DAATLALVQKRVDAKDPVATEFLAVAYFDGNHGLHQDIPRAIDLWTEAARLGDLNAHFQLGLLYFFGEGVEKDVGRGIRHWQHSAIRGHSESRFMLGLHEFTSGNHELAVQHWMITAKMGGEEALNKIKDMFMKGLATKAQYADSLTGYQNALEESKSPQRFQKFPALLSIGQGSQFDDFVCEVSSTSKLKFERLRGERCPASPSTVRASPIPVPHSDQRYSGQASVSSSLDKAAPGSGPKAPPRCPGAIESSRVPAERWGRSTAAAGVVRVPSSRLGSRRVPPGPLRASSLAHDGDGIQVLSGHPPSHHPRGRPVRSLSLVRRTPAVGGWSKWPQAAEPPSLGPPDSRDDNIQAVAG
ncbi:hypothetical protein THAOC_00841, partial [Thalassiosira oceanica]